MNDGSGTEKLDGEQSSEQSSNDTPESNLTAIENNGQTLTFDGNVYPMGQLPQAAIEVLNDLIRCENEAAEPRYRLRQLAYAQQSLTATLGEIIRQSGLVPLVDSSEPDTPAE